MPIRFPRVKIFQIKPRGIAHEREQPVPLALLLGGLFGGTVVVSGNFEMGARRKDLHRLREIDVFVLLNESDHVARSAAAETVIIPVGGVDGKRRCLFVVERTASPIGIPPALQLHVRADHFGNVVLFL